MSCMPSPCFFWPDVGARKGSQTLSMHGSQPQTLRCTLAIVATLFWRLSGHADGECRGPFRCYPPIRSSSRRSPSACPEKLPKIDRVCIRRNLRRDVGAVQRELLLRVREAALVAVVAAAELLEVLAHLCFHGGRHVRRRGFRAVQRELFLRVREGALVSSLAGALPYRP